MGFAIFLAILLVLAGIGFYFSFRTKQRGKAYGAKESCVAVHMYGVPYLKQYTLANLFLTEDKLIIEADKKTFELSYDQLVAAEALRKTELLKKDKSVIARGVVGGVLLGPIGAIIGGMSGIGKKKIKGDFLVLNYVPSGSNETKVMIFDTKDFLKAMKLAKFLKDRLPTKPIEEGTIKL